MFPQHIFRSVWYYRESIWRTRITFRQNWNSIYQYQNWVWPRTQWVLLVLKWSWKLKNWTWRLKKWFWCVRNSIWRLELKEAGTQNVFGVNKTAAGRKETQNNKSTHQFRRNENQLALYSFFFASRLWFTDN